MEIEDHFDEMMENLKLIEKKLIEKVEQKENKEKPITEKKNSHLHMMIETSLLQKLNTEAKLKNISIAELVRKKLRGSSQLDRMESKIDKLLNI